MRTTSPFHDAAEDMAREFKQLANERQNEFEAEEALHEPGVKVAEE